MRSFLRVAVTLLALAILPALGVAQATKPSLEDEIKANKAFEAGNALMEQKKYAEALVRYREVLAIVPEDASVLYNAGMAAFSSKNFAASLELWQRLKAVEPTDWRARAKLVQTLQALNKLAERDVERAELFAMWSAGKPAELKEAVEYCRDQFEVNGKKVMAFELFELKGERALRYVFSVLNEAGDDEEFRISLGSYEFDQKIWRELTKPTPKPGERLFHLDGYFKWGHATYGMYAPEPTYDAIRTKVVRILEEKDRPAASSTNPTAPQPTPPKP